MSCSGYWFELAWKVSVIVFMITQLCWQANIMKWQRSQDSMLNLLWDVLKRGNKNDVKRTD